MKQIKRDTWYKVYYSFTSDVRPGQVFTSFVYAMNEVVAQMENQFKAEGVYVKTEEWIVD